MIRGAMEPLSSLELIQVPGSWLQVGGCDRDSPMVLQEIKAKPTIYNLTWGLKSLSLWYFDFTFKIFKMLLQFSLFWIKYKFKLVWPRLNLFFDIFDGFDVILSSSFVLSISPTVTIKLTNVSVMLPHPVCLQELP